MAMHLRWENDDSVPACSAAPIEPSVHEARGGGSSKGGLRSDRFLETIAKYQRALIVAHDNPDPDALATGWAILELVRHRVGIPTRFVGGGEIIRAENKHLVDLLNPPIELVSHVTPDADTAVILVDCGIGATHHLLAGDHGRPTAVIDHHVSTQLCSVPFSDIRPNVAASASIAATYLRQQGLTPDWRLATALVYALKTETRGGESSYSPIDRRVLNWLTRLADPELLIEIEDAPLSRDYFGDMVLALQNTFLYERSAFCLLPRAEGPEVVGEVADLLIRCKDISQVFCGTVVDGDVYISVRTDDVSGNATDLLHETLAGLGHGGGHQHRAGGKIEGVCLGDRVPCEIAEELRTRWLAACHVKRQRGTRLIRKQEIVKNL